MNFGVFFANSINFAKFFEKITKMLNLKIEKKKKPLLEIGYENISELLVWPMPSSTYCNMG